MSVLDKVTAVYRSDSTTYTYHSSQWLSPTTAKRAAERVGQYNSFRPGAVADAIDRIAQADPNALFCIGREGSPVVYVQTHSPRAVIGVLGAMDEYREPNELDKVTGGPRADTYLQKLPKKSRGASVVRAWWD